MFRYKSIKQAFAIAVLASLLCTVCLTGATLALFTSNPEDGTIGVVTTSGLVDVDIVDDTEKHDSLMGGMLQFYTTADQQEILFEPGATFRTQAFLIENKGNIPVNFRMYVSNDVDIDMEEFDKAFDVWITTDPNDPTAGDRMEDFKGRLEAGHRSDKYYLFVRMKETAGNDFQGASYEGIGVTVYAVQGNVYNVNEEYNVK